MKEVFLVVGLGNPGMKYRKTRHNLGFMVIDELIKKHRKLQKFKSRSHKGAKLVLASGSCIVVAKPLTYMNRSGEAVVVLLQEFNVPLRNLLVVVDDLALPFGKIRLRSKGTAGGHNGLHSIITNVDNTAFPRLRVGIGRDSIENAIPFVLGKFDKEERKILPQIVKESANACISFIEQGITKTMSQYN